MIKLLSCCTLESVCFTKLFSFTPQIADSACKHKPFLFKHVSFFLFINPVIMYLFSQCLCTASSPTGPADDGRCGG